MKKLLFEKKIYLLLVLLFWLLIIFVKDPFDIQKGTTYEVECGGTGAVIPGILEGTVVDQKFISDGDEIKSISLFMATYGRENSGDLTFELLDSQTSDILASLTVDMGEIQDNTWHVFNFNPIKCKPGKEFIIRLRSDKATSENSVTVYYGDAGGKALAQINGAEIDGSLNYQISYVKYSLNTLKIFVWLIVMVLSFVVVLLASKPNEKSFLVIAVTYGLILVFTNPFAHYIDESTHFFRSYMISQGDLIDYTNEQGLIGGDVAVNYASIVEKQLSIKSYFGNSSNWNQSFSSEKSFYYNPYMSSVTPLNHSVAALGVAIGRLLHLPAILVILLGRLFDLAFYIIFCYLAIKNAKYYKNFFFMVSLLPMGLWLAASYSIDPILIGASLLFISICLKYYFDCQEKVSIKDCVMLLVCGTFIASVKYLVYTPILLFFFFIPKKKFGKKQYWIEFFLAIAMVLVMVIAQVKLLGMYNFTEDRNGDVDVARQIHFVMDNIVYSIRNFTAYFMGASLNHIESLGYFLAFDDINALMGLFVIFGAPLETQKFRFKNKKSKGLFIGVSIFVVLVVYGLTIVALYAGYTPVGQWGIDGLQTRYLVPIIVLLMFVLSFVNIDNRIKKYDEKITIIMELSLINMVAGTLINVFC